jgi:HD-GYP domain-containing protein (c-di-GMP phosphodiesterase class II)/DNA-binding CsgD family transcriptional regulator
MTEISRPLRLAEAVGALSLATDLAMGQPLEHGLRTAVLAVRMAQAMGLPEDDQVTVFYTGLLHFAGCTAESEIDARFFGDELSARPQMMAVALGTRLDLVTTAARVAHPERARLARAAAMARSAFGGITEFRKWAASHCDVARVLGARMGFSEQIQQALRHLWERWDGKGMPGDLRGDQIPLAVRLMQVAQDADMAWHQGGSALADQVLAERAGSGLDPAAVTAFLSLGETAYAGLDAPTIWEDALLAEPGPRPVVDGDRQDACLSAIADFTDLKSMWTVGHSRGVAELAERSALVAGLAGADALALRRAGLVHDIGRVAVPVNVWAKRGPLNRDEREQVRLHAYHTERVLDAAAGLRPLARLAGSHGERCDGSGYHRGSRAGDLPLAAWLLATADCYHAMREPRPYRQPLSGREAADELSRQAEAGLLAPDAVHAVLTAAARSRGPAAQPAGEPAGPRGREAPTGGPPDRRAAAGQPPTGQAPTGQAPGQPPAGRGTGQPPAGQAAAASQVTRERPAGLSERECEVLGLLARGLATKQVARRLGISPKTCDHHIQRLYGKAGVSTRAGATLFALEHGLVRLD